MNRFSVTDFLTTLREAGCDLGEPFSYFEEVDSTNSLVKQYARDGGLHGACFLADHQTAGRGRHGRHWHAAPGENLLFSVLLRPRLPAAMLSPLTLVLGLGVRDALAAETTATLKLKWPNDIVVHQTPGALPPQASEPTSTQRNAGSSPFRKLAGILTESELSLGEEAFIVAGIGVNVHSQEFPGDLAHLATSLALLPRAATSSPGFTREILLTRILQNLSSWLSRYQHGGLGKIHQALNEHDALLGQAVRVDGRHGIGQGIDERGQLLLKTPSGTVAISSGTVELT
ncbi:MAG: Biotin-(acetyl-CoA-carboxylase) ligase [Pseudomonadota bacterium]|jgi:BirA family biotin operon repressor/biotin-[acetyl-CoA-carboxylase] ligase